MPRCCTLTLNLTLPLTLTRTRTRTLTLTLALALNAEVLNHYPSALHKTDLEGRCVYIER